MIGYLDEAIWPLVLIMSRMSGCVKTIKADVFLYNDDRLLKKYKCIWPKIEDLKYIELNYLPVYDRRYMKTKIRTYGEKVYTNFHGLNVPEDNIECWSFTVISIDSLFVYENKYYLQVYLGLCTYKIVNKQIADYLGRYFQRYKD